MERGGHRERGAEEEGRVRIQYLSEGLTQLPRKQQSRDIIPDLKLPHSCINYPISSVEIWGGQMKLFESEEAKED